MRKTIIAMLLFTLSVWSAGSASPGDVGEIRSLRLENNRAIASRNVALMRRPWSQTIRLIEGDGTVFTGSGPLAASYASLEFKDARFVAYVRRPISITIGTDGRSAAEYGTWTSVYKTPKRDRSGRYFASWRKVDGEWKIIYEAYVSLGLATQASPPTR